MIKILLVDDHELVRTGIEALLNLQEGLEVVGVAQCGETALELLNDISPDVVLMDIKELSPVQIAILTLLKSKNFKGEENAPIPGMTHLVKELFAIKMTPLGDQLLSDLSFWSLAYCSFAPHLEPWLLAKDSVAATIRTQKTVPGIFKQKERLLEKYYGIKFHDIFKHETFKWAVKYNYIDYSQEWLEFVIEKIYPECKPFNDLSNQLIEERASYYKKDKLSVDRQANPERNVPAKRLSEFYDNKFGEGRYRSKFGEIDEIDTASKPWNWDTFKYS